MSTTTYERIWRNVVACAAAILVLPSPAWALDISNSFLKTDLVGYFPFNGNANDESSFGNNGVLNGPALGTNRFGYRSNSFVFASVGSFIRTSGSAGLPLSTSDFTASLWLKLGSTAPASDPHQVLFANGEINQFQLNIAPMNESKARLLFFIGGGPEVDCESTELDWVTNRWYNLQLVRAGDTLTLYRDRAVVGQSQTTQGNNAAEAAQRLDFGYRASNNNHQFYGQLDDISFFGRRLTDLELQFLYATENTSPFPHRAIGQVVITNGTLSSTILSDLGFGYTNVPTVRIVGGGGTGGLISAELVDGSISQLHILAAGSGYTNAPRVLVESPPGEPSVEIAVSRVNVVQHVRVNHAYVLESSARLTDWQPATTGFFAENDTVTNEFRIGEFGTFFRLRELGDPSLASDLALGLVAYYPFNGNADDESGSDRRATVYGAALNSDRHGHPGSAFSFDGLDDYLYVLNTQNLPRGRDEFTVSLWVSIPPSSTQAEHKFILTSDDIEQWQFFLSGQTATQSLEFYTGRQRVGGTLGLNWQFNHWYHIAFVRKAGNAGEDTIVWFRDSVQINSVTTTFGNDSTDAGAKLTIGRRLNGYGPWIGSMDDIRIYNRALSASEIQSLHRFEE